MRNKPIAEIAKLLQTPCEQGALVSGYQIDSRLVGPMDLFFALPGEKTDGHEFLQEAKARGAAGAVVQTGYSGPDWGLVLLRVEDAAGGLRELARRDLEASGARVVGVTGSVGKTTTKDFIAELLRAKYRVGKTPRSYNTKLTLPLSILNREGGEEVFVLEMGMSEPGDIGRLLKIAEPEIAVVTKIALAHSAYFPGGIEEIAKGKAEIFKSPKLRAAVYGIECCSIASLLDEVAAEKISFSLDDRSADYFLSSSEGKEWVDEKGVRAYQFLLPFKQKHIQHNFLAAASIARWMKLDWDEIHARIPHLALPEMRFQQFERGGIAFVNDAYNANPESMKAAFESLPNPKEGGKRIGVLGTMSPLGSFSEQAHRETGRLAQKSIDHLLVVGEEAFPLYEGFQEVKKPAEHFACLKDAAARLQELMSPGDVVLVKGSRIMQMENLFELLRQEIDASISH